MALLADKVAVITGARSGIGAAIAEAFAAEGASLVLASRRIGADHQLTAPPAAGARVIAMPANIAEESDVTDLFERAKAEFGRVDILINNAGGAIATPIDQTAVAAWRKVIDVNVTGAFLCARAAFPLMKAQGGGRIINIGSVSARVPRMNSTAYTTSKFALEGFTRALALEGRAFGIAVSILNPGNTQSGFWTGREDAAAKEGIMSAATVARVALLMASLPADVNMLDATMLPVSMPLLGRG